jgi:hypothetical protein
LSRKGESGDFIKIHTEGAKNISGFHQYSFIDKTPEKGLNYYQLKQNDKDGKFTFSKVVFVRNSLESASTLSVYPNPADQLLMVNYPIATLGATLKIINLNGKIMLFKALEIGSSYTHVDISELTTGAYVVLLEHQNQKTSLKFIKK